MTMSEDLKAKVAKRVEAFIKSDDHLDHLITDGIRDYIGDAVDKAVCTVMEEDKDKIHNELVTEIRKRVPKMVKDLTRDLYLTDQ